MLSEDDRMVRALIGQLMCEFRLDVTQFQKAWNIDLNKQFPEAFALLQRMETDGLLNLSPELLSVTEKGRFLIRNICMVFDRYLPSVPTGFSKAI